MAVELELTKNVCYMCGKVYPKSRGVFPINYAALYKGVGRLPVCIDCVENMYNTYLSQCSVAALAMRQVCRKLDLYWDQAVFDDAESKSGAQSIVRKYLSKLAAGSKNTYAGKCYDDTLSNEGRLWDFAQAGLIGQEQESTDLDQIDENVILFWGPGYTPDMYVQLEKRLAYWMSRLPNSPESVNDLDIGTETIIKQACALEIDIARDRAAGRSTDKSINTLNTLLGSAGFKPSQKKEDSASYNDVPFGVGIGWCEKYRPISEPLEEFKDVDGIRKYINIWLYGHLAKMLGKKNLYSRLYDEEMARLRVERPQYSSDEDDEDFIYDVLSEDREIDDK